MTAGEAWAKILWAIVLSVVLGVVYWWCAQRLSLPMYVVCYVLGVILRAVVANARSKQ